MAQGNILVVEDDPTTSLLLTTLLEQEGFAVRAAHDGLAACRAVASERPDLILLDLMLPDMSGWELCAMVRTLDDPQVSTTPIVIVTSRATEEDKLKGLRLGADDYVTKPFSIDEIVVKVKNLVARRLQERQRTAARVQTSKDVQVMLFHELRNHLSAVSAFARRIEANADILPPGKVKSYAGFIRKSSDYLEAFAEEILLTERLESNRFDARVEEVPIKEIAEGVVAGLGSLAEDRGISVKLETAEAPASVRANRSAVQICLSNLLDNALRYSPSGGTVTLRVGACADGRAAVDVEDNGPGIPEQEADRIFEKFFRGELAERTSKGTGLGLYIVKTLAAAENATIRLETNLRGGSRFRMEFPCTETG
jgi:signal transduction histidine kinase